MTALTIGFFDGVHLGHQHLLSTMRTLADTLIVATFTFHPSALFHPERTLPLIYPFEQKLHLLRASGAGHIIPLTFTPELAALSPTEFLRTLPPFDHLVLGQNAAFGHNRAGNEQTILPIAKELQFTPHFLPKHTLNGSPISSGRIRTLIAQGDYTAASALLGRPYP